MTKQTLTNSPRQTKDKTHRSEMKENNHCPAHCYHRHISSLSIGECNGLGGIDIVVQPDSVPVDSVQLFIDKPKHPSLELKLISEFTLGANTFRTNFLTRLRRGRCNFPYSISWSPPKSSSSSKISRSLALNIVVGVSGTEGDVYRLSGELEMP
jgi:hypothetical protein